MDYKSILKKLIFISIIFSLLSGCDTEVSPEPLRIIGTPPDILFYDSPFEFEFGASGGDGVYRYRYIQNPDVDTDEEILENPVAMNIEVTDDAKASFILRGVPSVPEGAVFSELNSHRHIYRIELTDGQHTVTRDFEFSLNKNKIKLINASTLREGAVTNQAATNLQSQMKLGENRICKEVGDSTYEKYLTDSGEFAYPNVIQVVTEVPVASRTELFYRYKTSYNDSETERSERNIAFARSGVDYIDSIKSIVLEPGQLSCVVVIDLLDDLVVEEKEGITLEFFDHVGGAIDYSSALVNAEILDNEIQPVYSPRQIVRNKGEKVVVPITLSRPVAYPININVSINSDSTTASTEEFKLEPASGVVTIEPGEIEASYSVSLLKGVASTANTGIDKIISISTDIDNILDVDPYTIEINEWSDTTEIESEIVGKSTDNEEVVDFIVDGDGFVTTLLETSSASNITSTLRSYNKQSLPIDFIEEGDLELAQLGLDVIPKALVTDTVSSTYRIAAVLSVDGLFADVYRGGTDFVVMLFQKDLGGAFNLLSAKQFGTDGDDTVSGARLVNGILYVYGKTNGDNFEGAPSFETNNGGDDGFLYAIDLANNSHQWSRFIGTSGQDTIVSVDVGNRDIVALVSTQNSDEDAFVRRLSTTTGLDVSEESPFVIDTIRNDHPVAIRFDSSASGFRVLFDSDAVLGSDDLTPSLSRDVQFLQINSKNEKSGSLSFATNENDSAKSIESMPDNQSLVVSGDTLGTFDDNVKRGDSGADIFTAIVSSENLSSLVLTKNLQFGTSQEDHLISVKPVSNTKFFALWSEDFTEPNNTVYRISAFSIDGKKLSRDPQ